MCMSNFIIIISPSKTQNLKPVNSIETMALQGPKFYKETQQLYKLIKKLDKEAFSSALGVKGKKLDEAFEAYNKWEHETSQAAIGLYTGSVFKAIRWHSYTQEAYTYMNEHLRILSAFYGVLKPFDAVKPYRLDMSARIFTNGPAAFWSDKFTKELNQAGTVVNLASDEFSKLVHLPMIHIHFKERTESGALVTKSTYAKMARGAMVDFAICNLVEEVEALKNFSWEGYTYSKVHSTEIEWTFIREGGL